MNLEKIKSDFESKELFETALTHRSWVNENPGERGTNERLEFLGDAILEFVVSKEIFNKLPEKEEGYLTNLRANIVNTKNLAKLARKMELGSLLFLSHGEEAGGGRDNDSLLADTVEAIIGAIYIDRGIEPAEEFVKGFLLGDLQKWLSMELKDAKSLFQEKVQAMGKGAPRYIIVSQSGPDHSKEFEVAAMMGETEMARGSGKSKSAAEQEAAALALEKLENKK